MPRSLELLPVPTGDAVLDLLPRLAAALAGEGPALLPVPASDHRAAERTARTLRPGATLSPGEDDEGDPTAFVVTTSGSTGVPKGALLPVSAVQFSARATRRFLLGAEPTPANWLLALPAQHIAGLQVLLRSLVEGTVPIAMDTDVPFTAARFAAAAARLPAGPRLVSLVPTQLQRILGDPAATEALAGFDAVLIGGAPAQTALLAAAATAAVRVVTTYGMSETCGGCVYDGDPFDEVTVTFDDAGRISLAGPVVARGYRGRPGHNAFTVDSAGTRRFRTDDVGELVDGRLRVSGRSDDLLITGGVKIAPAPVEATLAAVPGVTEVVLTGVPDAEWGQVLIAVVAATSTGPDPDALRFAARDAHGAAATPRAVVLVDALPLRGPGKPDRSSIRELAARAVAAHPRRAVVDTRTTVARG